MRSCDRLRWFLFLLHPASQLSGRDPADTRLVIHLRLEPQPGVDLDSFIGELPQHFLHPTPVTLSAISGVRVDLLHDGGWPSAWGLAGEASEWVLRFVETHADRLSLEETAGIAEMVQFLHFITHPLGLGHQCRCTTAGSMSF